jgi:hypothetical protein
VPYLAPRVPILTRWRVARLLAIVLGTFEAPSYSRASASDIRRGKKTPQVSTWKALAKLDEIRRGR